MLDCVDGHDWHDYAIIGNEATVIYDPLKESCAHATYASRKANPENVYVMLSRVFGLDRWFIDFNASTPHPGTSWQRFLWRSVTRCLEIME